MPEVEELVRLRGEYADRERKLVESDIYSRLNPAYLFRIQSRERAVLALLRREGFERLHNLRILEVGCGSGSILFEYLSFGATRQKLHGADLLVERVAAALRRLPGLPLTCADGQYLPYASRAFDLVVQYTVLSSILDDSVRRAVALEMLRVLSPGGMIVWFDFWLNPFNRKTRGIRPAEIRRLYPNCSYEFHRITLAPPITRRLARFSWLACYILESLRIFNSHYLVAIRPLP